MQYNRYNKKIKRYLNLRKLMKKRKGKFIRFFEFITEKDLKKIPVNKSK